MKKVYELDFLGKKLVVETGELAKQANGSVLIRYNDNRELIPEIFYFDELYYNINLNFFGIKSSNKMIVHNIILPENCFNSSHFIYIQRMNFESNEIKNFRN